jgi:hypothetical protein
MKIELVIEFLSITNTVVVHPILSIYNIEHMKVLKQVTDRIETISSANIAE